MRVLTEKSVDLSWEDIDDEGAKAIATAMRNTRSLKHFSLYHNRICDNGAKAIAVALKENTTIQILDLGSNQIGNDGAQAIAFALYENTTLQELYIGNNNISDNGAKAIATALKRNSTLTKLNLYNNTVGDDGAIWIRDSLEDNTALRAITLLKNEIDDILLEDLDAVLRIRRGVKEETPFRPKNDRKVGYDWMTPHRWFPQSALKPRPYTYHLASDPRMAETQETDGSFGRSRLRLPVAVYATERPMPKVKT